MIPERKDGPESDQQQSQDQVEYVGAPSEYADRDEAPEFIQLLAKTFAGIGVVWAIVGVVFSLAVIGCMCWLCTSTAMLGAIFGG